MRQRIVLATLTAALAFAAAAPVAEADFGVASFSAQVRKSATKDDLATQAGSHPFVGVTDFTFNNTGGMADGNVKNIRVDLPPGLVSNPQATPKCTDAQFPSCPPNTKLGTEELYVGLPAPITADVFNMVPKPGQLSAFAFSTPLGRTDIIGGIRDKGGDYGLFFTISDVPQSANLTRSVLTFYGVPAAQNGGGGPATPFVTLPTSCDAPLTTRLSVESYAGQKATAADTTPTGPTGCDSVPFAPVVTASTSAKVSQTNGVGLLVNLRQELGEANPVSVSVQLPPGFAARLDTTQQACPEATFNADPKTCPDTSKVGTTSAATPMLAVPLTGTVYMVSHGSLPTLEAVLEGPGVTVGLSGTIELGSAITSTFGPIPDLPITLFVLDLPAGPHSALGSSADLCAGPLIMPTKIVSHSGKTLEQKTTVAVSDCGIAILRSKVKGTTATLTLRAPGAGTVSVSGKGLKTVKRALKAGTTKVKLTLTKKGVAALKARRRHHKKLSVNVTARFAPASGPASKASKKLLFR